MKVPKSIKAFGRSYSVLHDNEVTDYHDCYGLVMHGQEHVYLQKRGPAFSEAKEGGVLMHEIFHIIDENLRCGLTEDQVGLLATGMYAIIVDNQLSFLPLKK